MNRIDFSLQKQLVDEGNRSVKNNSNGRPAYKPVGGSKPAKGI
jgi:hypothetical protein